MTSAGRQTALTGRRQPWPQRNRICAMAGSVTIGEIERFFVDEAALLDEWRLEEWLALFTEDGRYLVPPLDAPEADHRTTLFLVADDRRNLASRVRQLLGGSTWAENPHPRRWHGRSENDGKFRSMAVPARRDRRLRRALHKCTGARPSRSPVSRAA